MKTLEEKKLLIKMAKMFGQPVDPALIESIEREEKFAAVLFKEEVKPEPEQIVEETVIEEPQVLIEAEPPPPAFVPPVSNVVQQTINVLSTSANANANVYFNRDVEILKRQIGEMMQKITTLSWGGGGTGVVRFDKLDDHGYPRDIDFLSFNEIQRDPTIALTVPAGTLWWNTEEDCLNIRQSDNTTLQVGLEQYIRVKNFTGNTINNGTLVQFAGVNGGFDPLAEPLLANTTFDPLYTIGVLTEAIANGEAGRATTFGKVRNLNTTGSLENETWNLGDLLWANPTQPGLLTNIKPTAPNVAISIAAVTRVDATEGEILVRPTITPRLFYGNFAQTANQALTSADTAYPVLFDRSNFSSGHVLNANGTITSQVTGLFKYDVNYNITSSNASRTFVYMWIRKNGVDQQNTALRFSIESNGGESVPHGSFVLSMHPNDNVQMMIAATGTSISLFALGNTAFAPSAPSAVLSITQINQ